MSSPAVGALRLTRAAAFGTVAFALALLAHTVSGGPTPRPVVLTFLAAGVAAGSVLLTGRKRGTAGVAGSRRRPGRSARGVHGPGAGRRVQHDDHADVAPPRLHVGDALRCRPGGFGGTGVHAAADGAGTRRRHRRPGRAAGPGRTRPVAPLHPAPARPLPSRRPGPAAPPHRLHRVLVPGAGWRANGLQRRGAARAAASARPLRLTHLAHQPARPTTGRTRPARALRGPRRARRGQAASPTAGHRRLHPRLSFPCRRCGDRRVDLPRRNPMPLRTTMTPPPPTAASAAAERRPGSPPRRPPPGRHPGNGRRRRGARPRPPRLHGLRQLRPADVPGAERVADRLDHQGRRDPAAGHPAELGAPPGRCPGGGRSSPTPGSPKPVDVSGTTLTTAPHVVTWTASPGSAIAPSQYQEFAGDQRRAPARPRRARPAGHPDLLRRQGRQLVAAGQGRTARTGAPRPGIRGHRGDGFGRRRRGRPGDRCGRRPPGPRQCRTPPLAPADPAARWLGGVALVVALLAAAGVVVDPTRAPAGGAHEPRQGPPPVVAGAARARRRRRPDRGYGDRGQRARRAGRHVPGRRVHGGRRPGSGHADLRPAGAGPGQHGASWPAPVGR